MGSGGYRESHSHSPQTMYMPRSSPSVWGGAAHLWGRTGSRSRGCGSRGRRHAGTCRDERFSDKATCFPALASSSQPNTTLALPTSAWLPAVRVFRQRWHLRQGRCQFLPKDITFSAGVGEKWQFLSASAARLGSPPQALHCHLPKKTGCPQPGHSEVSPVNVLMLARPLGEGEAPTR